MKERINLKLLVLIISCFLLLLFFFDIEILVVWRDCRIWWHSYYIHVKLKELFFPQFFVSQSRKLRGWSIVLFNELQPWLWTSLLIQPISFSHSLCIKRINKRKDWIPFFDWILLLSHCYSTETGKSTRTKDLQMGLIVKIEERSAALFCFLWFLRERILFNCYIHITATKFVVSVMLVFGKECLVMVGDGIVLLNYSIFPGCRNNDYLKKIICFKWWLSHFAH